MYIEELFNVFDDVEGITAEELRIFKKIVICAGSEYLNVLFKNFELKKTDVLKIAIKGYYIENSKLLNKLGIVTYPQKKENNNFISYVTYVDFPIKLFTHYNQYQLLKIIHK